MLRPRLLPWALALAGSLAIAAAISLLVSDLAVPARHLTEKERAGRRKVLTVLSLPPATVASLMSGEGFTPQPALARLGRGSAGVAPSDLLLPHLAIAIPFWFFAFALIYEAGRLVGRLLFRGRPRGRIRRVWRS